MKIRYNIADQKKINYFKFVLFAVILFLIALILLVAGIYQLSSTAKQFRDDKDKIQSYKDKIEDINKREVQQTQAIATIKAKWSRKQLYINSLITDKMFPYLEKLDKLEKLFPAGAFIRHINLNPKDNELIQMTISAMSPQKLLETYSVFLKYDLVIQNEPPTEPGELCEASIIIRLKNENQAK